MYVCSISTSISYQRAS